MQGIAALGGANARQVGGTVMPILLCTLIVLIFAALPMLPYVTWFYRQIIAPLTIANASAVMALTADQH